MSLIEKWVRSLWYRSNIWCWLFWPFGLIFRLIVVLRRYYWQRLNPNKPLPVPVVIVGNLTVGGTGKTPLIIWLADFFRHQGLKPIIISRGYGARKKQRQPTLVDVHQPASEIGDEPLLIAQRTQVPVIVCVDRYLAAQYAHQQHSCDIILSDDGLQHYALPRTVEIAVMDGNLVWGNGHCLPGGPLREPLSRLQSVDYVICNGHARPDTWLMTYQVQALQSLSEPSRFEHPKPGHGKIHAVAGIGYPERFFNNLKQLGYDVIPHDFSDHYRYERDDFHFAGDTPIVMTEKDAVKCRAFANDYNIWYVPIVAQLSEEFGVQLLKKIQYG